MLAKRIIPCLDIKDGRVVKGVQFADHKDAGDPVELAKQYAADGADELVFYDITASADNRDTLIELVKRVGKEIFIPFTVGGGIRTLEDMRAVLLAGADKVSINTAALQNPDLINQGAKMFGSQCIVVGIDSKDDRVYSHTGRASTTQDTGWKTVDWVREVEKRGAGEITLNAMNADGTKAGYDITLLKELNSFLKISLIASGGAGTMQDFADVFIQANVDAALAASVFHYGEISISELKEYLSSQGIEMRNI